MCDEKQQVGRGDQVLCCIWPHAISGVSPLASASGGKLGKPVLQTKDVISGKSGAKKGRKRIVSVLKTRRELFGIGGFVPRRVVPDAAMRVVL